MKARLVWTSEVTTSGPQPHPTIAPEVLVVAGVTTGYDGAGWLLGGSSEIAQLLESQGVDVAYATNVDQHADPAVMQRCNVVISCAHDEYYSMEMRPGLQILAHSAFRVRGRRSASDITYATLPSGAALFNSGTLRFQQRLGPLSPPGQGGDDGALRRLVWNLVDASGSARPVSGTQRCRMWRPSMPATRFLSPTGTPG